MKTPGSSSCLPRSTIGCPNAAAVAAVSRMWWKRSSASPNPITRPARRRRPRSFRTSTASGNCALHSGGCDMKGEAQVIERLNEALFLELGAVNQYWLHFRLLEDWGYTKLAKKERAES